ncbi:CAT RNA binding domain-containing protein [Cellulomonas soli]
MNILRVFNNNVVLAREDDGTEVILTGWGLGYQTRPGIPSTPPRSRAPSVRSTPTTPTGRPHSWRGCPRSTCRSSVRRSSTPGWPTSRPTRRS